MVSTSYTEFLHSTQIFASVVREILGRKYLRESVPLDLTIAQFNLVRLIATDGNCHIREIAGFLGVSQPAASKNVDKLVRLGLVERQVQPADRRSVALSPTPKGRSIVRKYEALKEKKLKEILKGMAANELQVLTEGLGKVSCLILEREQESASICMKCDGYYMEHCPIRTVSGGCIYVQDREPAVP